MKILRHIQPFITDRATGILLSGSLLLGALPAIAQNNFRLNLPDLRAPGNRESGATRSTSCIDPEESLVALVPESNYGLTRNGYPTFYFYLPSTSAPVVKFIMYDEETNELFYEGQFSIQRDSGIVGVTLPNNGIQKALEVGRSYVWYVTVVCDPDAIDQSANAVVEATVARVASPSSIDQFSDVDLLEVYAEAGLWHDALAASAELKQADNPTPWNVLLNAVELEGLISAPVLSEGETTEGEAVSATDQDYE